MLQPGLKVLAWLCFAFTLLGAGGATVPGPAAVRARMSDSADALRLLRGGERVVVGPTLAGDDGCWTSIIVERVEGFIRCDQIERDDARPGARITVSDPQRTIVIETLLELSGARRQIAQLTDQRQFRQLLGGRVQDANAARLQQILANTFRPDAFYRPLRSHLERNLTPARTPELLQWLHSPLSRKVVDLEIRASAPDARNRLLAFGQQIQKESPSQNRLNPVQRLDHALRASEFRVEMAMVLIRNVTQALSPGGETRRVEAAIEGLRADLWRTARDGTLLHFLFTYGPLSDEDLEEYVRFWESDSGRWFAPLLHDGFLAAIRAVTNDLIEQLQRLG